MSRRLKQAAILVVVFAAAQLVRPNRANPATDVTRTIQAHQGTGSGLVAVLDRACRDCHTNGTVWPWYTQVAPLSWLMASAVRTGDSGQLLRVGRVSAGPAANAAGRIVP